MKRSPRIAILGAGPAGSALAALLARQGIQSVVFDDEKRPALLVGESLIPAIVAILQRMGIEDRVAAIAQHKPGASFVHHCGTRMDFNFMSVKGHLPTYAYNVPRPEFDDVIKEYAKELGVKFVKHRANLVAHPGGKPELELDATALEAGGWRDGDKPALVVDASGRSRTSAKLLGIKAEMGPRRDTAHFAHFAGIEHPYPQGQIAVMFHEWGWSWRIPLRDRMSFGIVMNPKGEQFQTTDGFRQAKLNWVEPFEGHDELEIVLAHTMDEVLDAALEEAPGVAHLGPRTQATGPRPLDLPHQ